MSLCAVLPTSSPHLPFTPWVMVIVSTPFWMSPGDAQLPLITINSFYFHCYLRRFKSLYITIFVDIYFQWPSILICGPDTVNFLWNFHFLKRFWPQTFPSQQTLSERRLTANQVGCVPCVGGTREGAGLELVVRPFARLLTDAVHF